MLVECAHAPRTYPSQIMATPNTISSESSQANIVNTSPTLMVDSQTSNEIPPAAETSSIPAQPQMVPAPAMPSPPETLTSSGPFTSTVTQNSVDPATDSNIPSSTIEHPMHDFSLKETIEQAAETIQQWIDGL